MRAADDIFREELSELLPDLALSEAEPRYLEEPRGRWFGQGGLLAKPASTEEVSQILKLCHAQSVPVVPYGGGTGLVSGQIMPGEIRPLILSLEKMTSIRDADAHTMIVEAGLTLAQVQEAAEARGRLFPLSLASQGTARIGGCLATNAGGVNVLRYGNTRELCLGVEAVLADGTIVSGLKRLRKDNTGYDIKDLMIGSEGSLGVITAASLRLFPRPSEVGTAFFVVKGPEAALELLEIAEARMVGCVSAFELIARQGLEFLAQVGPEVHMPFAEAPDWMVLCEIGLPAGMDAEEALAGLFEAAGALVSDGVIAQSGQQRADMWALRENIPEANKRIGSISSHDVSVPLPSLPAFIKAAGEALAELGDIRVNCFGHVGDGNLHYNAFPAAGKTRADYDHLKGAVKDCVYAVVDSFGGSVSAEHGIGRIKTGDLERYGDAGKLAVMRAVKAALDPNGIMNPGAVLVAGE
ncbi:FAD-binding oxidoreductase [Thioclava kandeliae]|uniref:FAD-binding oxidoreductase n=1 Tax=Thioclava kandeliae TaxID=3070818 RepID=A0ABV1SFP5_9RHOB